MPEVFDPAMAGFFGGVGAWFEWANPQQFEAWIRGNPMWAPLIAVGLVVLVSLLPLPIETMAIVNGMMFGPWLGSALTWVGALIAAMIAFCIARFIGHPLVERYLPPRAFQRLESITHAHGAPTLIAIRMIPLLPFTVINYGAGVTPVRWQTFLWTSAVGMIPPTIVFVALGDLMMTDPWLAWGGLGAVALLSFSVVAVINRRRTASSPAAMSD